MKQVEILDDTVQINHQSGSSKLLCLNAVSDKYVTPTLKLTQTQTIYVDIEVLTKPATLHRLD
jgi:hypothetical protein